MTAERSAHSIDPRSPNLPRGGRLRLSPDRLLLVLLIFVPIALIAQLAHASGLAVFICSCLAIVPLAGVMGGATEKLATRLGAGVGALLNATFGNAAELIIALAALQRGLHDVVKASLTGSIIGNGLLVIGLAILCGGMGRERQSFDRVAASSGATLLVLAAIGLVVPAMFHFAGASAVAPGAVMRAQQVGVEHALSLGISVVLFATYLLSLIFSLKTHRHIFAGAHLVKSEAGAPPVWRALITLLVATALIAVMSELLVGAIEEASRALGFTRVFVGVIVVAVVGNAAEHSTAVLMAIKNQMDLAMNIGIGSGLQIALFVAPLLVFASYAIGPGPMDLLFTPFEVLAVLIAVVVLHMVALDGETNWLEGVLLLAVYLVLAIAFYFLP
jgi:Ca2+:H+ antiporter